MHVTRLVTVLALATIVAPAYAQMADPGPMVTYYFYSLVKGANASPIAPADLKKLQQQHQKHIVGLIQSGKMAVAGPFPEEGRIAGIGVLRAASLGAAKAIAEADPMVKAGHLAVEMHKWMGPQHWFGKPAEPIAMGRYHFGFLKQGANADPIPKEQLAALQKAHLAYMDGRAKEGVLVMAGPFVDAGDLRGLVVYKAATPDEARALAEADPMIKAGRLVVELHPWMTPKGLLPDK